MRRLIRIMLAKRELRRATKALHRHGKTLARLNRYAKASNRLYRAKYD